MALLLAPDNALHWLTEGNASGIAIGVGLLLAALRLPPGAGRWQAVRSFWRPCW